VPGADGQQGRARFFAYYTAKQGILSRERGF